MHQDSEGTAHGIYKNPPKLAFERLKEITQTVKRPIVLHGGSDVPNEQIEKAISLGIAKINVDTELRQSFTQGMLEILQKDPEGYRLAISLGQGQTVMQAKVQEKIRLFGSANRKEEFIKNNKIVML
ncbi:class II fructose-bisphosphate aldolase [Bacillus sp. ISL-34]|uniref:class II fructose-bisphosphate aldolase n=1 Tax=Bacillus sp. ISL-34 TaxID=2819121 RepID=UPI001BECE33A|nr:class II fructose-bisphosphate aldolase [Bacillus sp. ISL-34]MBT2648405.1 class II fructose-bisphosphate aldolase [Bacillus sp. ISL-34]